MTVTNPIGDLPASIREVKPTFPTTLRMFAKTDDSPARVVVTFGGHWYRSGDVRFGEHHEIVCRGCGHRAYFDHRLDEQSCTGPATLEDVVAALNGPARNVQPGNRVRFTMSEYPDPVCGTIRRIYRDAIGTEVAEIGLPGGKDFLQSLEFLTLA